MGGPQLLMVLAGPFVAVVYQLVEAFHLFSGDLDPSPLPAKSLLVSVDELLVGIDRCFVPVQRILVFGQIQLRYQAAEQPFRRLFVFGSPALEVSRPLLVILVCVEMIEVGLAVRRWR